MNFLDIIIGIPILWFAYKGFSKGFISELTGLVALILAIICAIHFSDITADFLQEKLNFHSQYMPIIAFIITFIVVLVVIHLIGKLIRKIIHTIQLGFLDRLLGFAFSILKVVLIMAIVVNAFDYLNDKMQLVSESSKVSSYLYEPLNQIAEVFYDWFDFDLSEWGEKINEQVQKIKEKIS